MDLTRSVSSIRRMKLPPVPLAKSQLNSAVLREPRCMYPVGEGANRVLAGWVPVIAVDVDAVPTWASDENHDEEAGRPAMQKGHDALYNKPRGRQTGNQRSIGGRLEGGRSCEG